MSIGKVLEGKTALVTGASHGIGKASARMLAEDGATVMIMGRRDGLLAQALADLRGQVPGARIEAFQGDAGDAASAQAAIDRAHAMNGRLDIIVSAVGRGIYKPILMCDESDVLDEFRLSFLTAFFMIRYGVPRMERGGAIVCVSSTAGTLPCAGLGPYAAAKAGLEMFVKVAADEVSKAQIRINAVRPGFTRAEGTQFMFDDEALLKVFTDFIPLGRAGESDDLARAIRFLAGPESGWVTGQIFAADGGQELRGFPDPNYSLDQIYGAGVMDGIRHGRLPEQAG
ncbi:MAG: SDR family oxidoreductase [Novosphingobium sp.]|jgi:NAD(P)-dependent dehydrogenase (short-subunit alcohol dehydrogenase family)|nr:SDR family oxidoreductase [Novosphingobium sp.]